MKKSSLAIISLFAGAMLFVFAFAQVDWEDIRQALMLFPGEALLLVFAINFLAIFMIGSYRWQLILKSQGCHIPFWKIVRAKLAGYAFSYITPSALIAGEPVRAYMLKSESDCGWERSSASVILDQMIYLAVLFFIDIFGFLFLMEKFSLPVDVLYGFWAVFALVVITFYLFFNKVFNRRDGEHAFFTAVIHRIGLARWGYIRTKLPAIERTEEIIETFFRRDHKAFVAVVALAFADVLISIVAVMAASYYLGFSIGAEKSLAVFSLWSLANLVPIPGALGSSELALSFVFDLLGAGKDTGLVFSLIFRFINILLCLGGILASLHFAVETSSYSYAGETPPILMKMHKFFQRFVPKKK